MESNAIVLAAFFVHLLVGHLVGDFLLQNDWMAANKKKRHWPCFVHVLIYTIAVCMACRGYTGSWILLALFVFVPHYLIDRWNFVQWYMYNFGQYAFAHPPMSPWSRIAVDQSMHMYCLWATAWWLM